MRTPRQLGGPGVIIEHSESHTANVLFAALTVVSIDVAPGATSAVLESLPLCRQDYLLDAAHAALKQCAGPNDVELLRTKLAAPDPDSRAAAAVALAQVFTGDSLQELYPVLEDANETVALSVARTLADIGDRRSLPALVRLLESAESSIRAESALVLQGLTGQQMGFTSYGTPEERSAAVSAWRDWVKTESATAELTFPVYRQRSARDSLRGHTLVSTGSLGEIVEMDASGKTVWSYSIDAWSAEKLVNGNVLIGSYSKKKVLEIDKVGQIVWQFDGAAAMTAKPLLNGNILVADFSGRRVIEINRKKSIVWEHKTPNECFDADRLANGNTIFGCPNLVREVTPEGKTVREWEIKGRLNGFQALPNGNILVANYGENKVYELTPTGETVWTLSEPRPCDVFRARDGMLLVATASRIVEFGPDKKLVRELKKAAYGSVRR